MSSKIQETGLTRSGNILPETVAGSGFTNRPMRHSILLILLAGFTFLFAQECLLSTAESAGVKAFSVQVTGSGRPMILIPGLGCGGNVWDSTVAHFKGTYQCHVLTLAGFAGQPPIGSPFLGRVREGLSNYIRDQKLQRPIIIGHSLGGFLAFWLGATIPDQVGPIIAVDGVPYIAALRDAKATPESSIGLAQASWMSFVMESPEQFSRSNQRNLAAMITDPNEVRRVAETSNRSDTKAMGQAVFEMMTIDLRPKLKAIRTPVLLIGETSSIRNPDEKKTVEENYRMQVSTIPKHQVLFAPPKVRHFIQLDAPDFFRQEVEAFLKSTNE